MNSRPVDLSRVVRLWLPLAASWLLMAAEQPMLTATVARMADAKVHLAAWGAVVFPIALIVEAPIIMLLAASTALCVDWSSYRKVRRFMWTAVFALTGVHLLIAFTPLFDWVCGALLDSPPEIIEPARTGLQLMTPWAGAIAYRRFQQGVMIRMEDSRAVTEGTAVRLCTNMAVLWWGYRWGALSGIALGSTAIALGVTVEGLYSSFRVRRALGRLRLAPPGERPLDRRRFLQFYVPLATTPLVMLLLQPMGSAAMGRMPQELDSLAAWAPVFTMIFIFRSVGMGYNEVVVALMGQPGAGRALRRFTTLLALGTSGALMLIALTPLRDLWFGQVQALGPELAGFAGMALLIGLPMPAYQAFQSWYQGVLVASHRTRPVIEAVLLYAVVAGALCTLGVWRGSTPGLFWALGCFVIAGLCQTAWLWWRSRPLLRGATVE